MTAAPRWNSDGLLPAAPGRPTPAFKRFIELFVRPLVRVAHRPRLEGVENLPATGPYLLVANHSAGMAVAEILCFIVLYLEKVGADRPLAGFAHPVGFRFPPASQTLRGAGAIPSTYEAAEATLAAGVPILAFPGGDHETQRPIWQAHRVDFGGRKGFLRIARAMQVPIVPMGIRGSHFSAPILLRSRLLAWLLILPRLVGLKRWSLTVFGLAIAALILLVPDVEWYWRALIAYLWSSSPFIFTSWIPATIRFRIGRPITPDELFTSEDLDRALARVQAEVQQLVSTP